MKNFILLLIGLILPFYAAFTIQDIQSVGVGYTESDESNERESDISDISASITTLNDDQNQVDLINDQDDSFDIEGFDDTLIALNTEAASAKIKKKIPILMFHNIQNVDPSYPDRVFYQNSYSPQKFEELLIFLRDNNIETLTFYDLVDILNGYKNFPDKAVILSFDDGLISGLHAFDLLEKYNSKGVFFIIAQSPDSNEALMSWRDIKRLADHGHEIGSHTFTHPKLTILADQQISDELSKSKELIEERIGKQIISIAYPSGEYDTRVKKIAESEDYIFGRSIHHGNILNFSDRYVLPTMRVFPYTTIKAFEQIFEI